MKKINTKRFLPLALAALSFSATAQIQPPSFPNNGGGPDNFYKDYVGVQLVVSEPAAIAGPMIYTISNDGTGAAGEWGAAITSPIFNKELVMADPDSLGCVQPTNSMTGKIALIWRGDCEFGAKAFAAQNAGADAIIIVNHTPGGPVGMGAGAQGASVTIPVIMISKEDGHKIWERIKINNETVKVSFKTWGFGHTSDLGILHAGVSLWHAFAVPGYQLVNSNGNPLPYKGYDGAFIANFGTAPQVAVKLKSEVTFTPQGQTTATTVRTDSVTIPSFLPQDSVYAIGMNNPYDLHPSGTGRYDVNYTLSATAPDQFLGDNSATYSINVTNDIFSKSRYDFERDQPIATIYTRYASSDVGSSIYGNLYYNAVGGHAAVSSKFSISKGADFPTLENTRVTGLMFVWKDSLFADSLVQLGEMELVGQAVKDFTVADSGGLFYELMWEDVNTQQPFEMKEDTWYWVAMDVPMDCFVGFDGIASYFPRSFLRHFSTTDAFNEFPSVAINFDLATLGGSPNLTPQHFIFDGGDITAHGILASDSGAKFSQQKNGFIPALSLKTSMFPMSVGNTGKAAFDLSIYPNPATDMVNVAVSLERPAANVSVTLLEMTGKRIGTYSYKNVKNEAMQVPVNSLPNGVYLMYIDIDGKRLARQFSITK